MQQRTAVVVIFTAATFLTLLALAGHNPWSGTELIRFSHSHGVNTGDVFPVAAWLVTSVCCAHLWRQG